jgi:hypothetical protein
MLVVWEGVELQPSSFIVTREGWLAEDAMQETQGDSNKARDIAGAGRRHVQAYSD